MNPETQLVIVAIATILFAFHCCSYVGAKLLLNDLRVAAKNLYKAGYWSCPSIPVWKQKLLWDELRIELGISRSDTTVAMAADVWPSQDALEQARVDLNAAVKRETTEIKELLRQLCADALKGPEYRAHGKFKNKLVSFDDVNDIASEAPGQLEISIVRNSVDESVSIEVALKM